MLFSKKITSNQHGILYKIYKLDNKEQVPIKFFLTNTSPPFGVEDRYSKKIIKWVLEPFASLDIRNFEAELRVLFNKNIENTNIEFISKIHKRDNFDDMLETILEGESFDIIKHEEGEVICFSNINHNFKCNVEIEVKSVNLSKDKIYYNLIVKKISNCVY